MPNEINFGADIHGLGHFLSKKLSRPITELVGEELNEADKSELIDYIGELRKDLILIKNEMNRDKKMHADEINKLRKQIRTIWEKL